MYPSNPAEQVKHTIENRDALSLDSSQEIRTAFLSRMVPQLPPRRLAALS